MISVHLCGGMRRFGTAFAAAVMAGSLCSASGPDIERFIENASITYEKRFELATSLERWNRMLGDPVLMGRLWALYGFKPAYEIREEKGLYHVIDPTGIEGELSEMETSPRHRIYAGKGKMKNWFVPVSLRGRALFILRHTGSSGRVSCVLEIYGEGGDDLVSKVLLKVVSPLLHRYIDRRVTRNLRDLEVIIDDMERNPRYVRSLLDEEYSAAFDRLVGGDAASSE